MDNGNAGEIDTSAHKYSHFHLINIVFLENPPRYTRYSMSYSKHDSLCVGVPVGVYLKFQEKPDYQN
jgi:hypothetical protein